VGDGLRTQDSIVAHRWYSVVAVFEGERGDLLNESNIRVFVDGRLAPADIVGRPPELPRVWKPGQLHENDACYIGFESHQGAWSHRRMHFDGMIDEVLVFNRALSREEIRAHARRRP
jgi:hypothetical protein